jgi:hypothetical protein
MNLNESYEVYEDSAGVNTKVKVYTNKWMRFSRRGQEIEKGTISYLMADVNTDKYYLLYEHAERIYYSNKHLKESKIGHIKIIYEYKGHLLRELTSYLLNGSHDEKLDIYYYLLNEVIYNFYEARMNAFFHSSKKISNFVRKLINLKKYHYIVH